MRLSWGRQEIEVQLPEERCVAVRRGESPTVPTDLAAAVTQCLESPFQYPPLRRALTPEDHVVVVIDPAVRRVSQLLPPILRQLLEARIDPAAVTLLCHDGDQDQAWVDALPDAFQEVHIETHKPNDRKKLAYLATTKTGRRVYLNRTVVDSDQIVVVTERRYDGLMGYAGGPGVLFPGLCDEETWKVLRGHISLAAVNNRALKLKHESEEIGWLLGAPFFVQVIESLGDALPWVIGGSLESCHEAERQLDAANFVNVAESADLVIATVTGDPATHTFTDLARALLQASRVVIPGGRIVVLSDADPDLGVAVEIIRETEESHLVRKRLQKELPVDLEAGLCWMAATEKAKVYVLSRMSTDLLEEMFVTPLEKPSQVQRLISEAGRCVILESAHKICAAIG